MKLYPTLQANAQAGRKKFAVLIDPDKCSGNALKKTASLSVEAAIDCFLVGGSLLLQDNLSRVVRYLKENTPIPVILFPGSNLHLDPAADAILLLSLISGRNPDLLIGRHVQSAPFLKASGIEILSTGYMLIDSGRMTTVTYMSNTTPIPSGKKEIAVCTAMAGEMLGMKMIYLDAGSGADHPVPSEMIAAVKKSIGIPLIVGGGITGAALATEAYSAGADLIVVGNGIENDPGLIPRIAETRFR